MKISRLLNKRNLLIFISFFFLQKAYSVEPVDIWKIETQNKNKDNVVERENISEESVVTDSIYNIQTENKNKIAINEVN